MLLLDKKFHVLWLAWSCPCQCTGLVLGLVYRTSVYSLKVECGIGGTSEYIVMDIVHVLNVFPGINVMGQIN